MRSRKTAKEGETRGHQPAPAFTRLHSAPSAEDQTWLQLAAPGMRRPPMTHMRPR